MDASETLQKAVYKDPQTQKVLNTPLPDPTAGSGKDKEFLERVMALISEGKIDLYKPETLINQSVYQSLPDEVKGQADFEAVNLSAAIREIKDLYDNGLSETFQMENLVQRVNYTKERLEENIGDVFII